MADFLKLRNDFPMLCNHIQMQGKPLVWLDNASTTLKPQCVIDAETKYYTESTSNSHRGDYDLAYQADQTILKTRQAVASLIHCDPNEVVLTTGATQSLNLVARGYAEKFLQTGDEILLTLAEHASNILPWYEVCKRTGAVVRFIPLDEKGRLLPENLEKVISEKTKIVSVAHVTNVLGYRCDAKALAKIAHGHGAILVLDGAQSVPHIPTDVKDLDVDFLAFSGHKMCGPTGIGVLYGKYDLLKQMDPLCVGGGMNVGFDEHGDASYFLPPSGLEAGTLPIASIYGFLRAVTYLQSIGMENIEAREQQLKAYARSKMEGLEGVTFYNLDSDAGLVAFNIDGVFAQDFASYCNYRGIAVRSGEHCAKLLDRVLKTKATVRASFYFYTTEEEIDALIEAMKQGGNFLDAYFS